MRVPTTIALAAIAASAGSASTAQAERSDCPVSLEQSYSHRYYQVRHVHGTRAPGRNIRKWGVKRHGKVTNATCRQLKRSRAQLIRLVRAPRRMHSIAVPPPQRPAGVQTDRNVAALPSCTWRPESGGSYSAVNPSSGAYGKYQIIPSTWAAHCSGLGRDPSGQEACAARVYAAQGAGAWVNC